MNTFLVEHLHLCSNNVAIVFTKLFSASVFETHKNIGFIYTDINILNPK